MKILNPLSGEDESVSTILEIAHSFQKSRALLTACELNLFNIIGKRVETAATIAAETGTDEKALERLMNSLVSMELLFKEENKYGLTSSAAKCLLEGSTYYLGNLNHLNYLWDSWSNLTEAVIKGTKVDTPASEVWDAERLEAFISAMHWRAAIQAPDIVRLIGMSEEKRILDLGGGSGAYSAEFARTLPEAEVIAFDQEEVIPITQKYLALSESGRRVKTLTGNFMRDRFGKGYDLVFLSSIIHSYSIWDSISLVQRIYDSLNHGGRIVIQEFVVEADRCSPQQAAMFSLNMLVNTKSGNTYTETELWFMLREAWFDDITTKETPYGTKLIIGTK